MRKILTGIVILLSLVMAFFHLYSGGIQLFPATQQRAIHLGLAFALIFLLTPIFKKKKSEDELDDGEIEEYKQKGTSLWINVILAVLSIGVGAYLTVQ